MAAARILSLDIGAHSFKSMDLRECIRRLFNEKVRSRLGRFLPLGVKHLLDLKHRDGVALEKSGQVRLVEQFYRI